jgi:hypothetical protein
VVGPGVSYSGRAIAVDATVLGVRTTKCDTGPLPSSGGSINNSYPNATIPGVLTAGTLYCHTSGASGVARTEAGVAHLALSVGGHIIYADALHSMARAACNGVVANAQGHSLVVRLIVNGQQKAITGNANQTIALPNGSIVINQQSGFNLGSSAAKTVTALRVTINGVVVPVADIKLSTSRADIECA